MAEIMEACCEMEILLWIILSSSCFFSSEGLSTDG